MKAIKFLTILLVTTLLSVKVMAQEQLVIPLSDPGKPYKVNVDLVSGSITVTGYDGKDIIIDVQSGNKRKHEDRDDRREEKDGMHRISTGDNLDVTAKEKNNIVNISSGNPMRSVTLNIKVPRNLGTLKLSTVNIGNISVSDINGELEVSNINGTISADNISGSVVASTVNGSVKVNFKSVDPKAAMAFSSLNGSIHVTFPDNLKANVKLKTDMGSIYTDFDVITDKSAPKVTKSTKDGMYSLKMDEWVYGKINGGGPEIMVKTMNGSIYIKKAK
jgi:hypothetical protein